MPRQKFSNEELVDMLHIMDGHVTKTAEALGVTRGAIIKRRDDLPEGLLVKDITTFRKREADTLAHARQMVLRLLMTPKKLKASSAAQLSIIYGTLLDKERVIQGKPTEFVAHAHLSKMHPDDLKMVKDMIKQTTQRKLEASQMSHKFIPTETGKPEGDSSETSGRLKDNNV